ncbi:hypothetical protein X797_000776 [Metarhizium robertsii]|uniref:Uncharacterized protein n=1 Tax=Metarhizium robertsii TaxID=568076 RepID=A0A0A1V941_9HYPO|nr:hypothetical protein X797_000776 [Metarhizium robertsii]
MSNSQPASVQDKSRTQSSGTKKHSEVQTIRFPNASNSESRSTGFIDRTRSTGLATRQNTNSHVAKMHRCALFRRHGSRRTWPAHDETPDIWGLQPSGTIILRPPPHRYIPATLKGEGSNQQRKYLYLDARGVHAGPGRRQFVML